MSLVEKVGEAALGFAPSVAEFLFGPEKVKRIGRAKADVAVYEKLALAQADREIEAINKGEKAFVNGQLVTLDKLSTQAKIKALDFNKTPEDDLGWQEAFMAAAIQQQNHCAAIKQSNLTKTLITARSYALEIDNSVSEDNQDKEQREHTSPQWFWNWRNHVENTLDEEVQNLWAKILVSEVSSPGSYSTRTLETLKTFSRRDAELVEKVAPYISINEKLLISRFSPHTYEQAFSPILYYPEFEEFLEKRGIRYSTMLKLQELGVVTGISGSVRTFHFSPDAGEMIQYGELGVFVETKKAQKIKLNVSAITKSGIEIFRLIDKPTDREFLKVFARGIVKLLEEVQVTVGKLEFHSEYIGMSEPYILNESG